MVADRRQRMIDNAYADLMLAIRAVPRAEAIPPHSQEDGALRQAHETTADPLTMTGRMLGTGRDGTYYEPGRRAFKPLTADQRAANTRAYQRAAAALEADRAEPSHTQRRWARRAAAGVCRRCGERAPEPGHVKCSECLETARTYQRERRARLAAESAPAPAPAPEEVIEVDGGTYETEADTQVVEAAPDEPTTTIEVPGGTYSVSAKVVRRRARRRLRKRIARLARAA